MTTSDTPKMASASLARGLLDAARGHLGSRRALLILAVVALIGGVALNWSWLVAAGIAPVLLTVLPCLVMCGLGLCMSRLNGGSCASPSSQVLGSELTSSSSSSVPASADHPTARVSSRPIEENQQKA